MEFLLISFRKKKCFYMLEGKATLPTLEELKFVVLSTKISS